MTGSTTTDDDYPIMHSPLERQVTRDGITVEICIYRGNEEPGWILEVLDQTGGSTVWEDLPSDQEALDLAMKAIEEEGIASFAEGMSGVGEPQAVGREGTAFTEPLPFDDDELADLEEFLDARSLASVVGMLAAVVSVPETLPLQLWLGELMKDIEFKNADQAQRFADLIMRLNNHVATAFMEGDPLGICPSDGDGLGDETANAEFCTGYLSIVRAAGIDTDSDDLLQLLGRIATGEEAAWGMTHDFDAVLGSLHVSWHPRTVRRPSPKIGRNDPCPCGSGKKFKKCHGANAS